MAELPMNPSTQKKFRDSLKVPTSPSFIDTDNEITGVVILNPTESPVNSAVVERGTLKANYSGNVTPAGAGNTEYTWTVPAGKKWRIKAVEYLSSSLVATVTNHYAYSTNYASNMLLYRSNSATDNVYFWACPFDLNPGDNWTMTYVLSAYTSGQVRFKVLYQEYDAVE